MKSHQFALFLLGVTLCVPARAVEPNETSVTATVLQPGIRSVVDKLTQQHIYPDTFLGIRSSLGEIGLTNDDNSLYGNGLASGLRNVPVDAGSIKFAVTGFGDLNFIGDHAEAGQYEVFVDVYDSADVLIDAFSEVRTLMPDAVHEFSFLDAAWSGGIYDVNIDNINGANDVDFFTFNGLTPGAIFAARTAHLDTADVDTLLGWYDAAGNLLDFDDDGGGGILSLIEGVVPPSGALTFAVSGFGDFQFDGSHSQLGNYELRVTQSAITTIGDYNGNGIVDAADYTVWRDSLSQMGPGLAADGDPNNQIDGGDYMVWKSHFGETAGSGALAAAIGNAIPEPSTALLAAVSAAVFLGVSQRTPARQAH